MADVAPKYHNHPLPDECTSQWLPSWKISASTRYRRNQCGSTSISNSLLLFRDESKGASQSVIKYRITVFFEWVKIGFHL